MLWSSKSSVISTRNIQSVNENTPEPDLDRATLVDPAALEVSSIQLATSTVKSSFWNRFDHHALDHFRSEGLGDSHILLRRVTRGGMVHYDYKTFSPSISEAMQEVVRNPEKFYLTTEDFARRGSLRNPKNRSVRFAYEVITGTEDLKDCTLPALRN